MVGAAHPPPRVGRPSSGQTAHVSLRVGFVAVIVLGGAIAACSSGPKSCSALRAELQQVTGGTSVDVSKWDDMGELEQVVTEALQLQTEIDRRCG